MQWLVLLWFVVAGAAQAQIWPQPTITPNAAQSCCLAWQPGNPGCDDSACEECICVGNGILNDAFCCGPALGYADGYFDYQCSLEALGTGGTVNCSATCACAIALLTPTITPTLTATPTGSPPTASPTPTPTARPQDCCDCTNFALCIEGSCNVLCPDLTPPVLHRNEICFPAAIPGSGNCAFPSPLPGQVIIDEDTPTPTTVPGTATRTPTNTRTATVTGTPPTATPTPTSSRQDCCECPEANCSIPPVNGTCPQGCTLVPNACCDCVPGGNIPAPTHTAGGSTAVPRPTSTPTQTRGQ